MEKRNITLTLIPLQSLIPIQMKVNTAICFFISIFIVQKVNPLTMLLCRYVRSVFKNAKILKTSKNRYANILDFILRFVYTQSV